VGSIYRRTAVYCRTCKSRLSTTVAHDACRLAGHAVEDRESAIWTIQYQDQRGRTKTESSKSANKEKARHILKLREGAVARRDRIVVETISFKDAVKNLITDYEINKKKSLQTVRLRLKHLTPFFESKNLSEITTAEMRRYIKHRSAEEIVVRKARVVMEEDGAVREYPEERRFTSNAEINRELTLVGRMFTLAAEDDKVVSRPKIPKLKEAPARRGFFEHEDVEAVQKHLPPHMQGIVDVAYVTGWRVASEVLPLEWRRVDVEAAEIRLDAGTTKSGEPRVFPFTEGLRAVLERQKALTGELAGLVFCYTVGKKAGKSIRYSGWLKAWRRAVRLASLPPERIPHDFRRTAVRNLERAGVPRSTAMAMIGHKTEAIYRRYAIVDSAMIREAAAKLDAQANARQPTAQSAAPAA